MSLHRQTLHKEEITIHEKVPRRTNDNKLAENVAEASLEASTDGKIEIDIDELGLQDIVSSIAEMKTLFHEVVGKRKLEAVQPNLSKKARTEKSSAPRVDNMSEFDPADLGSELSTPTVEHNAESIFPSVFNESEACGVHKESYRVQNEGLRDKIPHA